MKGNKLVGHLAAAGAYAIFGFNIIFNKDIANDGVVSPLALFFMRVAGAALLFWILSAFLPKEKVLPGDFPRLVLASFIGLFIPQMSFLFAIVLATPVDSAVLGAMTPVYTMCFAFLFLGEPITGLKAGGVAMSLIGVLLLIFNSVQAPGGAGRTQPLGLLLLLVNGLSFAAYLGAFRPLISRYGVVTLMKWMFLFVLVLSLPFCWGALAQTDFAALTPKAGWELAYIIVFATFVAYFLIPVGQKNLRPTLVSMYSYLQPMIAAGVGIAVGMDSFSWQKGLAAVLVFGGVALVSRSRAATGSPGRA